MARVAVTDPLSVAVIVPEPSESFEPATARVAVGRPALPLRFAVPSVVLPSVKVTVPLGVEPSVEVAVAVRNKVSFGPSEGTLLCSERRVMAAGATGDPFQ